MSYIILNKNKIEERIKELEEEKSKLRGNDSAAYCYSVVGNLTFLQELLKESIDAAELFNAAKKQHSWAGGHLYGENEEEDLTDFQYPTFLDYTKTLNI